MSSTGGTTQGGRGPQFLVQSERESTVDSQSNVAWTGNSITYIDIEEDSNNDDSNRSQTRIESRNVKLEWMFPTSNLALEFVSAILDLRSGYALIGMLIAYAGIVIGIIELIYKWKKEKVSWRWKKVLPGFYYPLPSEWPFTFKDIGFICAVGQSMFTTINYCDSNKHIQISIWPIIFAFGLMCSKFLEFSGQSKGQSLGQI